MWYVIAYGFVLLVANITTLGSTDSLFLVLDCQETVSQGRAIAQAVSRWLPTAAARVQTRV
jgi:hypothetical protein